MTSDSPNLQPDMAPSLLFDKAISMSYRDLLQMHQALGRIKLSRMKLARKIPCCVPSSCQQLLCVFCFVFSPSKHFIFVQTGLRQCDVCTGQGPKIAGSFVLKYNQLTKSTRPNKPDVVSSEKIAFLKHCSSNIV